MLSTIAGVGRDFATGRIAGKINELAERKRGEQEDEALLAFLCDRVREIYGDEPFYNDFDSFATKNRIVKRLIASVRGKAGNVALDKSMETRRILSLFFWQSRCA